MKKRDDKPAALDHVLYEMEMLVQALLALSRKEIAPHEGSGWLEVFATHARNLNEFFGPKDQGGAYMRPDHFVSWSFDYSFDSDLARRASAQVSHLTYDRERPEEKTEWPFDAHFTALRVSILKFLKAVSQIEELLAYRANRQRVESLIECYPKVTFAHVYTRANIA